MLGLLVVVGSFESGGLLVRTVDDSMLSSCDPYS